MSEVLELFRFLSDASDSEISKIVRRLGRLAKEGRSLRGAGELETTESESARGSEETAAELSQRLPKFEKTPFKRGDLVVWKRGFKNRRRPSEREPAIVVEVLDEPVYDSNPAGGAGSPYFREPLDLGLGILDADDDFLVFYFDSRRFELYHSTD